MTDLNEYNRVSEVIVGKIPKWISVSVVIIICMFILLVIILSYMVPYQTIITTDVKIEKIDNQMAIGKMEMLPQGYGMVKIGQNVIVSLEAYPENIYGIVLGKVSKMSKKMDSNGKYLIEISIDKMNSSNGTCFNMLDSQMGKAKIVLESKPIINQLFPMFDKLQNKHIGHM